MKEIPIPHEGPDQPREIHFDLDNSCIDIWGDSDAEHTWLEGSDEGFTVDLDGDKLTIGREDLANKFMTSEGGSIFAAAIGPGVTVNVGSIGPRSSGAVYMEGNKVMNTQSEITLWLADGGEPLDISVDQGSEPSGKVEVVVGKAKLGKLDVELKAGSLAVNSSKLREIDVDARRAKTRLSGVTVEGSVKVESTTGDIKFDGTAESWSAKTITGAVTVSERTEGTVVVSSDYGEVNNRRPSANQ